jgi:hypothetical protein
MFYQTDDNVLAGKDSPFAPATSSNPYFSEIFDRRGVGVLKVM